MAIGGPSVLAVNVREKGGYRLYGKPAQEYAVEGVSWTFAAPERPIGVKGKKQAGVQVLGKMRNTK